MSATARGRVLAFLAAVIAFVVYWMTLAHTITWLHDGADSGDLVAAAFIHGIPHPPGYPLYTLLGSLFTHLDGVEPAQGMAIFSALMVGAAVFVLARAGANLLTPSPSRGEAVSASPLVERRALGLVQGGGIEVLVAPIAALAFAFAPMVWSQATIAEVYALNLFFVALILWACCTATSKKRVPVAALAFGLGLAHHLSILLLLPGALIALQPTLKHWRALFLLLLPLLLYAYLPIAAIPNPAVIWGDPVTLDRFLWLVTAQQYRPYLFGVNGAEVLSRFAFSARALFEQFTFVGVALTVWGAVVMALHRQRLFVASLVMFVPVVVYAIVYASRDSYLYLIPAFAITLLWLVYGVGDVLEWAGDDRLLRGAAVALFALLPVYNLVTNYGAMDVSRDRAAFDYAKQSFQGLAVDGVLFADGDEALFATWYYRHAVAYQGARSVVVSQGLLQYDWYYDALRRTMSEVKFQDPSVVTDAHARALEIIRVTFAEGRQVCFTDSSPLLPEFEYDEQGVVKCVGGEVTR